MYKKIRALGILSFRIYMTAMGFEPTPLRTSAWSWRLGPLGQAVMT